MISPESPPWCVQAALGQPIGRSGGEEEHDDPPQGTRRRLIGMLLTGVLTAVLGAFTVAVLLALFLLPLIVLFLLSGGASLLGALP